MDRSDVVPGEHIATTRRPFVVANGRRYWLSETRGHWAWVSDFGHALMLDTGRPDYSWCSAADAERAATLTAHEVRVAPDDQIRVVRPD